MYLPISKLKDLLIVDEDDYERLSNYTWYLRNIDRTGLKYIACWMDGKNIPIHQVVTGQKLIDHINGDTLDNRKCNLRVVTKQQNSFNARKTRKKTSSKYKGVSWCKRRRKWIAYICKNYKLKNLGYFPDEKIAALAYNEAAKQLFGEYAHLNIIE